MIFKARNRKIYTKIHIKHIKILRYEIVLSGCNNLPVVPSKEIDVWYVTSTVFEELVKYTKIVGLYTPLGHNKYYVTKKTT